MESLLIWLFGSYRKFKWQQLLRKQSCLPRVAVITLSSCQWIFKRWRSFCPEAECSGPLFARPLLPGFHLRSCCYLVSYFFVSPCSITNVNYKGFVLCFENNETHIQISIYSSSSEGSATEVCVTPPRGQASISLHINTWAGNSFCECSDPKCTISPSVPFTGYVRFKSGKICRSECILMALL